MTLERADPPRQNLRGAGGGSRQRGPRDPARPSKTGRRPSAGGFLGVLAVLLLAGGSAAYVWTRTSRVGGASTCEPCNLDHASARCDATLRCAVDTCYRSFADCDRNPTNGCEADLRVDADHCGRCDAACPPLEHAERGCGGRCTIWRCARGFRDCNDKVADGCEVDVTSDARHCGRCGHACPGGRPCEHGRCV
jgi:hypothetical protein